MIKKNAAEVIHKSMTSIISSSNTEKNKVVTLFKELVSYPLKTFAAFVYAPILLIRVAYQVKNPVRRYIAITGLVCAIIGAYLTGTALGTLTGALLLMTSIGWIIGIGFLFGTAMSVYLSVIFSIIIFNLVSWIFLKIGSQEIIDYLNEISK